MVIKDNKVNIKARVDRHLRIVRKSWSLNSNALTDKKLSTGFLFVVFFLVIIFPIYPSIASFVYSNSSYDFYRWYIDESSIIEAYYSEDMWDWSTTSLPIIESEDSFLSVNTILNDKRDNSWKSNEIISYEVKPWESFSSIAYNFNVSVNSILWANDFSSSHVLRPWEVIVVPPVSWVLHRVVSGDNISSLAKKYDIWESKIREQNLLAGGDIIKIGQILVIPWAVKQVTPTKSYTTPTKATNTTGTKTNNSSWYNFANYANSEMTTEKWSYRLVRRKPQHSFAWWNCTWYVAQYKNVNWWGNANQWLKNAAAKWHSTWDVPRIWAIVQFSGTWYNPRYGHVWVVMEVYSTHLIVSDMNYRRINEVTYRRVPINDRSIDWYIYVD